jgi:hypothetical protein
MTVKKFYTPSLHLVAARCGLDEPARGCRVNVADPRRIGAHKKPHAAPALGGELQSPCLDLAESLNESHGSTNPATAETFCQRPKLVRAIRAAKQDQIPKVDTCGG